MLTVRLFIPIFCGSVALAQTPKPAFEVASVKPAAEQSGPGGLREAMRAMMRSRSAGFIPLDDPGRMRLTNWPLRDIIASAYRIPVDQVSGPSWMADQYFDIEARIPEGGKAQVNEMLQALLEERFGLKSHRESKTESGYALVVAKGGPKLSLASPTPEPPSDPEERKQRAQEAAMASLKKMQANPRKGSWRSMHASITMTELCSRLMAEVHSPVVDQTGIDGKYDIVIETSTGNPDEPDVTVFDAVAKMGLKLESRKVTVETLVVDQVLKTPVSN
jgi:uncharacterized protein (TIGR03435 family)